MAVLFVLPLFVCFTFVKIHFFWCIKQEGTSLVPSEGGVDLVELSKQAFQKIQVWGYRFLLLYCEITVVPQNHRVILLQTVSNGWSLELASAWGLVMCLSMESCHTVTCRGNIITLPPDSWLLSEFFCHCFFHIPVGAEERETNGCHIYYFFLKPLLFLSPGSRITGKFSS